MGISLKGIHFHCGSGQHGSSAFGKAVKLARDCLKIGRAYGHLMDTMDIGGGFPQGDLSPQTVEALQMTRDDPLEYRVIAEPGRHISANAFYVVTRVLGKREKKGKPCYHVNESVYHSFNCVYMDDTTFEEDTQFYRRFSGDREVQMGERKKSTIFGMTCDGIDVISHDLSIPTDLKVGDWLCFGGMGAYTYGSGGNFNGMKTTDHIIRWSGVIGEEQARAPFTEIAGNAPTATATV